MHPHILKKLSFFILITAGLAGCAAQGITLPESQFLRLLENKSGMIAYLGMDGNIYTINQAGSDKIQVTNDVAGIQPEFVFAARRFFAWSPDGSRLAYIAFGEEEWALQVSAPDGSDPVRLYASNSEIPGLVMWMPGGENVAFITQADPYTTGGAPKLSLHTAPADGSGPDTILLEDFPLTFSWEPGGDRALIYAGGSGEEGFDPRVSIFTLGAEFEEELDLEPSGFLTPSWSPDGTRLMMAIVDVQGRNALVVANLQGQVREIITSFDSSIAYTWSPDNRFIGYIASDRERQGVSGHLVIADPETGETLFETEEHLVHAFVWSPDSTQLIYFTQELVSDDGGENLRYGLGIHYLNTEDWEVRHPELGGFPFVFQPTPQFRQYLLAFDQYQQGATIWSPDGDYIILSSLTPGNQGVILMVPVSGNREPRQLDTGLLAFWSGE